MKKRIKNIEIKLIFLAVAVLFIWFLAAPIILLLLKSFQENTGQIWVHYIDVFTTKGFWNLWETVFRWQEAVPLSLRYSPFFWPMGYITRIFRNG